MKKSIAILLALAMILAINLTAFAETPAAPSSTLNITDDGERTYYGYQLLFVTSSLKEDEHHTPHDGAHNGNCYNFAYTVNGTYRTILQNEVHSKGGNYLWETTPKPATPAGITDKQIEQYLAHQTSDVGSEYHSMRQVADRLYRAILLAGIDPEEDALTGDADEIAQGYWIFADATVIGNDDSKSLVMVNTAGLGELNITIKTDLPTVEKKVKDNDDTRDSNITDNLWSDSADHDIGDTVPFKLTATLPSNLRGYLELDANQANVNPYTIIFHDTLSAGLTLPANAEIKVYLYNTKHEADVDIDMNNYTKDVTANFEIKRGEDLDDDCTFEAVCEDIFAIAEVTKDSVFVVYYTAELNEAAVVGAAGNQNEVYLEFSNDPYGDTLGKTTTDVVMVYTYKIIVNKIDAEGHSLKGAGFTLYKKVLGSAAPDQYVQIGDELGGQDDPTRITFEWKGLDDGDYKLVETTVPSGYNKMDDMTFTVSAEHSEIEGEIKLLALNGGAMGTGTVDENSGALTGEIEKDIVNNTGVQLPSTGAKGTFWLIFGGAMLVILASVFMITRKKMSVYED